MQCLLINVAMNAVEEFTLCLLVVVRCGLFVLPVDGGRRVLVDAAHPSKVR